MTITTPAPVAPADENSRKRAAWRPMAAAAAAGSVLLITGFGVWASLNAEATGVQSVDSGTLRLALTSGTAGFSQSVSNMAPGDTQTRYVVLKNDGTLEGKALSMKVATSADTSPVLVADTVDTQALRVTVANCAEAWAGGACSPGATTFLNDVMLGSLSVANPFAGIASAAAGQELFLKVTVALPNQDELYRDGVLVDSGSASVQGAKATLNYTFAETQRAGIDG